MPPRWRARWPLLRGTFRVASAVAQTAACANGQMHPLPRARVSSLRVGDAMEVHMYIGLGTIVIIILLILILR